MALFSHKMEVAVHHYRLSVLMGVLLACLAGCAEPDQAAEQGAAGSGTELIERLRMTPTPASGVEKVEIKSVIRASQAPELFEGEGLVSSAYYKYWKADDSAYKVRLNVYTSESALEQGWNKRFPAETLEGVQPLTGGVNGFVQAEKIGAARVGPVLVEIATSKQPGGLRDFLVEYAGYVDQVLADSGRAQR